MDKILGFLGILNRGRKTLIGESAYQNIEKGRYAFLASDCSANTRKNALSSLKKKEMPLNQNYSKAELGKALGYEEISFILITDPKAAKKLNENDEGGER